MPIPKHIKGIIKAKSSDKVSLNLSDRGLDSNDIEELVNLLNKNEYITEIDLSRNNLDNDAVPYLIQLKYIKNINLRYNNIDDDAAPKLAKSAFKQIDLVDNDLTAKGIKVFAKKSGQTSLFFSCVVSGKTQEKLNEKLKHNAESSMSASTSTASLVAH